MAFKYITFVATENFILIVFKGQRTQITKAEKPEQFANLRELLRNQDEDAIIKMVNGNVQLIEEHSSGLFTVDRQNKRIIDKETNTDVGMTLGRRIIEWAEKGLPFNPLLLFHRKLIQNPSKDSAADMYEFLEKNKIAIAEDGDFIAYKKVKRKNGKLVDCHTGTVSNDPGQKPSMPRNKVDPNRLNECSTGYHVAGWGYMGKFTGDVIVKVKVNPKDVVAVPVDYNRQKMRTAEYEVLCMMDWNGKEMKADLVKVLKDKPDTEATVVENIDFQSMTAQKIKDYIQENFGIAITTDNKNKQSIIKQANVIVYGTDASKAAKAQTPAPVQPTTTDHAVNEDDFLDNAYNRQDDWKDDSDDDGWDDSDDEFSDDFDEIDQ